MITTAQRIDALQRRLLALVYPTIRRTTDTDAAFFARRTGEAARRAKRSGEWSQLWASDIIKWSSHVDRQHDPGSWNHAALHFKGQTWLDRRRSELSGLLESRTRSRVGVGGVSKRWYDGLADARLHV